MPLSKIKIKSKIFFLIVIVLFLILLGGAIWLITKYLHPPTLTNQTSLRDNFNPSSKEEIASEWQLLIPSLNISAPIVLNVDNLNPKIYFKALEKGVAHMKDTSLPGKGNSVIFGHSNFYENVPGKYKTIFKHLDKLEKGDVVVIKNQNRNLFFSVSKKEIIEPNNTSVIQSTKEPRLTLITCWPPGEIDKRLVVVALLTKITND